MLGQVANFVKLFWHDLRVVFHLDFDRGYDDNDVITSKKVL